MPLISRRRSCLGNTAASKPATREQSNVPHAMSTSKPWPTAANVAPSSMCFAITPLMGALSAIAVAFMVCGIKPPVKMSVENLKPVATGMAPSCFASGLNSARGVRAGEPSAAVEQTYVRRVQILMSRQLGSSACCSEGCSKSLTAVKWKPPLKPGLLPATNTNCSPRHANLARSMPTCMLSPLKSINTACTGLVQSNLSWSHPM
mmetsp:Transcript_23412/g.66264  ORF Transcript_23412/g.66264 Transcript_23412/m.66264 type:complete len:205 (+) Transcript_23412:882-1496(+)